MGRRVLIGALIWGVWAATPARGGAEEALPAALEGVSIDPAPGAQVPLDLQLLDQEGKEVRLRDYLGDGKPLVLVLAYYRCPMLCSLVLNGLTDGMQTLAWTAGSEFRTLVVSIAPEEGHALAKAKRENYLREYGRLVKGNGFDFAVVAPGHEGDVRRLADTVGFRYRYDAETEQYLHAAGAFVLTPEGKVSQTLYGIEFTKSVLKLALAEASAGRLASTWDRVLLFCYHYDPEARGYVLHATRMMRAGGGLTMALLGLAMLALWRRELRRSAESRS